MKIKINGEEREVEAGITLSGLIEALGLGRFALAIERNLAIVPRQEHSATRLEEGDALEIVTLVGGG